MEEVGPFRFVVMMIDRTAVSSVHHGVLTLRRLAPEHSFRSRWEAWIQAQLPSLGFGKNNPRRWL